MPNVEGIPEERNITDYLVCFFFLIICGVFCIVVIIVFAEHLLTWEVIFKKCVSSI